MHQIETRRTTAGAAITNVAGRLPGHHEARGGCSQTSECSRRRDRKEELIHPTQHTNDVFHHGLAAPGRQRQDTQVLLCTSLGPVFLPQRALGEPEPTRREQIFAIAIVFKRARFANQPIDNMPVIDAVLAPAAQSGNSSTLRSPYRPPQYRT